MADTKLTALSAFTPVRTDLLYGVDDPGGTPASGKLTIADALGLATAADVAIADAGGIITADDVEDALQEIATNVDTLDTNLSTLTTNYNETAAVRVVVINAGGNPAFARPDLPAGAIGIWVNSPSEPTELGTYDIWAGIPGEEVLTDATTARTLTLGTDEGKTVRTTSGSAVTITLPLNSGQAFLVGTLITVVQGGTGAVTVDAASGVTLNGTDGLNITLPGQRHGLVLRKVATDTWEAYHLLPSVTAFGASLLDDADAAAGRTTLGAAALGANVFTGTQDFNGQQVEGNLSKVVTSVSGSLTAADHSGNVLKTSGNVTIPTTAGFNCILIAGGAHTVTFNSTTSAAMATGDVMTLVVESASIIHAVLTPAADKVSFT